MKKPVGTANCQGSGYEQNFDPINGYYYDFCIKQDYCKSKGLTEAGPFCIKDTFKIPDGWKLSGRYLIIPKDDSYNYSPSELNKCKPC